MLYIHVHVRKHGASQLKVKKVKERLAVNGFPSHSYGTSLAMWDGITQCYHSYLLPDTSERVPH